MAFDPETHDLRMSTYRDVLRTFLMRLVDYQAFEQFPHDLFVASPEFPNRPTIEADGTAHCEYQLRMERVPGAAGAMPRPGDLQDWPLVALKHPQRWADSDTTGGPWYRAMFHHTGGMLVAEMAASGGHIIIHDLSHAELAHLRHLMAANVASAAGATGDA